MDRIQNNPPKIIKIGFPKSRGFSPSMVAAAWRRGRAMRVVYRREGGLRSGCNITTIPGGAKARRTAIDGPERTWITAG